MYVIGEDIGQKLPDKAIDNIVNDRNMDLYRARNERRICKNNRK